MDISQYNNIQKHVHRVPGILPVLHQTQQQNPEGCRDRESCVTSSLYPKGKPLSISQETAGGRTRHHQPKFTIKPQRTQGNLLILKDKTQNQYLISAHSLVKDNILTLFYNIVRTQRKISVNSVVKVLDGGFWSGSPSSNRTAILCQSFLRHLSNHLDKLNPWLLSCFNPRFKDFINKLVPMSYPFLYLFWSEDNG